MKKVIVFLIIVLAILLVLCMAFIMFNKPQDEPEINNTNISTSVNKEKISDQDAQLQIIEENYDLWAVYDERINEIAKFVVTDLDHNGRFEVVVSTMGGSGKFSENSVYEVTEDRKSLEKCNYYNDDEHSESDFSLMNKCDVYYDSKEDKYYYVLNDYMQTNPNEEYEGIYSFSLKNGVFEEDFIASKRTFYDYENNNEEIVTYLDKYEDSITKDEYKSAVSNFFDGLEKDSLNLNWKDISNISEDKTSEIKASLSL